MATDINIQEQKIELIQWLSTIEDSSIIKKLIELKRKDTEDWYKNISTAEIESIDEGLEDSKNRNLSSHTNARNLYEKVGFVLEGILRKDIFFKGEMINRCMYGIIREE